MDNLKIATPPIRRRHLVPPWAWSKNLGRGFSLKLPRWEKTYIIYRSGNFVSENAHFLVRSIYATYPGWLSELGFFTCSHWLTRKERSRQTGASFFVCKLCQGPWISFVNVSRLFRMNPGKKCRKSGDDDEACAGWIQEVRGAGKTLVATELALWDSPICCFVVRIWIRRFHLQTAAVSVVIFRRCCRTWLPNGYPKKTQKNNRYMGYPSWDRIFIYIYMIYRCWYFLVQIGNSTPMFNDVKLPRK